jgi:hypothetical protein
MRLMILIILITIVDAQYKIDIADLLKQADATWICLIPFIQDLSEIIHNLSSKKINLQGAKHETKET